MMMMLMPMMLMQEVVLLVGPEGDFTEAEKGLLRQAGAVGVSLGPNRLRVETAALVLATATSLAWFPATTSSSS
jgi:16S rRNA (uracil1498-N3)-methyltransferase